MQYLILINEIYIKTRGILQDRLSSLGLRIRIMLQSGSSTEPSLLWPCIFKSIHEGETESKATSLLRSIYRFQKNK